MRLMDITSDCKRPAETAREQHKLLETISDCQILAFTARDQVNNYQKNVKHCWGEPSRAFSLELIIIGVVNSFVSLIISANFEYNRHRLYTHL